MLNLLYTVKLIVKKKKARTVLVVKFRKLNFLV